MWAAQIVVDPSFFDVVVRVDMGLVHGLRVGRNSFSAGGAMNARAAMQGRHRDQFT